MDESSIHPDSPRSSEAVPDFSPGSRDLFEARYNRSSFLFHHDLHEHEMFSWNRNQGATSVALSVNFDIRSVVPLRRVYRVNARLRKLGLNPVPPGISAWRDKLKSNAVEMLQLHRHRNDSEKS